MKKSQLKRVAEVIVNHAVRVKKGDIVLIKSIVDAKPLFLEVYKQVLKKDPKEVITDIVLPEMAEIFYKNTSIKRLEQEPPILRKIIEAIDVAIHIYAKTEDDLNNIDPKKFAAFAKGNKEIGDIRTDTKRWVLTYYPNEKMAKDAGMSLQDLYKFYFDSINLDWKKEYKKLKKIKAAFDNAKEVRILGKETDIRFSLRGRQGDINNGQTNLPDGEVFYAPKKHSVNGYISYSGLPQYYKDHEVKGIKLCFKDGKVIKASAKTNQDFLMKMLDTDQGSRYIGEFGIGVNPKIHTVTKEGLFDEKIGGTVHFALGDSYEPKDNKSAIHFDMVKDLRQKGEIYVDGELVFKNGEWIVGA